MSLPVERHNHCLAGAHYLYGAKEVGVKDPAGHMIVFAEMTAAPPVTFLSFSPELKQAVKRPASPL